MGGVLFTNQAIEELHTFVQTGSGENAGSFFFGQDSGSITTARTLATVDTILLYKPVTWTSAGTNSKFSVGLTSLELVGSYINRGGLVTGSLTVGSLFTIEESVVGSKTIDYTINITGEVVITLLA